MTIFLFRPDLFYYLFLELFLSDIWRGGREKNKNKALFPHFSKVSSSDFQSGG
jgi:hypothetical protein